MKASSEAGSSSLVSFTRRTLYGTAIFVLLAIVVQQAYAVLVAGQAWYHGLLILTGAGALFLVAVLRPERIRTERSLRDHAEALRKYDFIVNTSQEWMVLVSRDYRYEAANDSYCRMHAVERGEIIGRPVEDVWGVESFRALSRPNFEQCFAGRNLNFQMPMTLADGRERYYDVSCYPYRGKKEEVTHAVVVSRDITEQKHAEDQLRHDAMHDALTGLPNRALFLDRLERAVVRRQRSSETLFAVLFMDLDRFKLLNDSMGHLMGDKLLMDAAERIRACVREGDTVARLGGDEFTVLLEDISSEADAGAVAERIRASLARPFHLDREEFYITVSIGIALSTDGYEQHDDMLRDADAALYSAKREGGNRQHFFHSGLHHSAVSRLQTEGQIRRAARGQEFEVYYMPIVDLREDRVVRFEALIRWHHPERGLVPPSEFIPIAEETGLIMEIGAYVLERSARQVRDWREAGYDDLTVSVNCSARQFQDPSFVGDIETLLGEIVPGRGALVLELTESAVLGHEAESRAILSRLHDLGLGLAIDDFGTGYSSLGYLNRLPFDELKIDKSFVDENLGEPGKGLVVAVIQMARTLGLRVVAEGIETAEQAEFFQREHCDLLQGYYYSPAVAADAATEFLKRGIASR